MTSISSSCLVLVLSGLVEKRSVASFTSPFTSSTEHLQWYFWSMRLYSFLSPFEVVLWCTGVNCCNAKWDAPPPYPDSGAIRFTFTQIPPPCGRSKYTNSISPRNAQHRSTPQRDTAAAPWGTAQRPVEDILQEHWKNPYIWYLGDVQAKSTQPTAGLESAILAALF